MLDFNLRIGCLLGFLAVLTAGCDTRSATSPGPLERRQSSEPDTANQLVDLDGRPFDLWRSEDGSAATVILFTRHDCPISNRYAPTVNRLHEAYHPRGVRFYLVYVDPQETPESIRRHLEEFGYPCQGLRDPAHALVAATGATVTPEAVVYDSQQKIIYRGRIDDLYADYGQSRDEPTTHELADAIEAALSGSPVPPSATPAVGCPIGDLP